MLAFQHPAQAPVAKGTVADKADTLDLDDLAFFYFKNQIDAVVGPPNNDGIDCGRQLALLFISLRYRGSILFSQCWRINPARLRLNDRLQIFVLELAVAFDADLINRRKLLNLDHQR